MDLSAAVLGKGTADTLRERGTAPVLVIGRDRFTRGDLAGSKCFNYTAAANLSAVLATFVVKDTKDLFDRIPPSALAVPRIGAISLAVLGACFELKRVGGDSPLAHWVTKHATEEHPDVVTFTSIKHRVAAAARRPGQGARAHGTRLRKPTHSDAHRPNRRGPRRALQGARPARREAADQ